MITLISLSTVLIFSQYLKILGQWDNCINRLTIARQVVIHQIDIEQILPFSSDDGQRLNLRQVNLVEREDSQYLSEPSS